MESKMKALLKLTVLFLIGFTSVNLWADEINSTEIINEKSPGINLFSEDDFWDEDLLDFDFFKSEGKYTLNSYPTIEFQWGFTKPSTHKDLLSQKFFDAGSMDFKIGHTKKRAREKYEGIVEIDFDYVFLGRITKDFVSSDEKSSDKVELNAWRFGVSSLDGYAYKLGGTGELLLYHSKGMVWTKPEFSSNTASEQLVDMQKTYDDAFRFGNCFEGGIKYQIVEPISVNVGFERTIVYPRHLFWYWTGSEIIEGIGHGLVSGFVKEVMKSSPIAAPIVNFLLQNAISYGSFELRKKNMNWPFDSAMPLLIDNYKVGVSFAF